MGAIGGLMGNAGGASGSGFKALTPGAIQNPVTKEQLDNAYGRTGNAMDTQEALVAALGAQNGIGNQSNVYNQYQDVVAGKGPNPAQAMLAQQTGQNTQNQAALMAGQRGAGANAGLLARQAAQQGAANQQNSIGQGATLQANQSLNALGQAGNIAGQQVQNQAAVTNQFIGNNLAEQQALLNANAGVNANNVALNQSSAGLAQQNMSGQQGMLGGLMNNGGSMFSMLGNMWGPEGQNFAKPAAQLMGGSEGGIQGVGGAAGASSGASIGGAASAGGAADTVGMDAATMIAAEGGNVEKPQMMADGGYSQLQGVQRSAPVVMQAQAFNPTPESSGPSSSMGQYLSNSANGVSAGSTQSGALGSPISPSSGGSDLGKSASGMAGSAMGMFGNMKGMFGGSSPDLTGSIGASSGVSSAGGAADAVSSGSGAMDLGSTASDVSMLAAKGGMVKALVSPGEVFLPPRKVSEVKKGKDPLAVGKKIPGKPKYPGNDYRNDVVPAKLEEGGIVIPNKVLQSKDPHKEAAKFVAAALAKRKVR